MSGGRPRPGRCGATSTSTRLSQEDAYRFARGEEVTSTTGVRAKLSRPLDWLVISDHAEMYGLMFSVETNDGKPLTKELAALRAALEPLVEVTQIKGDGESHPFLSPNDEFADYETWDDANLDGTEYKKKEMLQYDYARSALKIGMQLEKKLGVNPFKFGMAGGTDSHTSLPAVAENNFFGKHPGVEPAPKRWESIVIKSPLDPSLTTLGWQQAAGGYTAVWAMENTREAIFDAMVRKETYATTGSRISVRFFGGWGFATEDAMLAIAKEAEENPELVKTAPHDTPVGRVDEVRAARDLKVRWVPEEEKA